MNSKNEGLLVQLSIIRTAVIRSLIFFMVVVFLLLPVKDSLLATFLCFFPSKASIIAIDLTRAFWTPVQLVLHCSFLISLPFWGWQIWSFLKPALYPKELWIIRLFLWAAVFFFILGWLFAYLVVIPIVIHFLISYIPDSIQVLPDVSKLIELFFSLLWLFSLSFELPLLMTVITFAGYMSPSTWRYYRGYAIVAFFVIAAVVTPPDVFSQCLLAFPLCFLYECGIWGSILVTNQRT